MPIVEYRGKKITFADDLSEAEINDAMGSVADQVDLDLKNESATEPKGMLSNLTDFFKNRYGDSPDLKPYTPNEIALSNEEKSSLDFKTADDLGNVIARKGKFGSDVSSVISPAEKQVIESQLANTTDESVKGVLQEQLTRPTSKRDNKLTSREALYSSNQPQKLSDTELLSTPQKAEANVGNITDGILDSLPQGLEATKQGIRSQYADLIGSEAMSADAQLKAQRNRNAIDDSTPAFETETAQGLYSGATSLIQQVPGMAAAIATGNPLPALAAAGLVTEAEAYTRYKERGATAQEALTGAVGEGAVEVLTELTPMRFLVDKVGTGKFIAGFIARDALREQVATLAQDAIDTAIANPNKTWGEYLAERPSAAYQTLLATVVQAGVIGGANAGARKLLSQPSEPNLNVLNQQNAQQEADAALAGIGEATNVDDAIALATETIKTPLTPKSEAIDAAELLNDESLLTESVQNVGNIEQGSTGLLAAGTIADELDNPSGSAIATDNVYDELRPSSTGTSLTGDISAGTGNDGNTALSEPLGNAEQLPAGVDVVGDKIDNEWTAFNPDTGTLGIPRAEMPQIKAEHRGAMVNFLNARGIDHEQETLPADSLKPTQLEFSEEKVNKAIGFKDNNRSILISADNHVLDGHHQWLAKLKSGEDIDVIRLKAPIQDLLGTVAEFPSAQVAEGATSITSESVNTPETKPVLAPVSPVKKSSKKAGTLLATLRNIGGISNGEKLDVTGEKKGFAPGGYNQIFKLTSKKTLRGVIESGDLDDFLPPAMRLSSINQGSDAFDSAEAYDYLTDKIRSGERVLPYDVEQEVKANKFAQEQELNAQSAADDLATELLEDEINEQLNQATNEEREATANARVFNADSEDSVAGSGEREAGRVQETPRLQPTPIAKTPNESSEREGVRELVTALVKRRAAANELGKAKQFDEALQAAKDFMAGKDVKPAKFLNAALAFNKDQPTKDAFNALLQLAKAPAKEARKAVANVVDDYKAKITAATTEAELTALGNAIQKDKSLSDAQAIKLDDAIADAQDKLTINAPEVDNNLQENTNAPDNTTTQETEPTTNATDLLGDNTAVKQAIADAARAKDAQRNSGTDNQDTFTLTGSNSEADQAAAAGAQDLFAQPIKQQSNTEANTRNNADQNTAEQSNNSQRNSPKAKLNIKTGYVLVGNDTIAVLNSDNGKKLSVYGLDKIKESDREQIKNELRDIANSVGYEYEETTSQDEVAKAAEALTEAGVTGKERLDTIKDVRQGNLTADEVAEAYATNQQDEPAVSATITDFGEKLEGAKKDLWQNYKKAMTDELPDDLSQVTLAKYYPEPDYDNLIASGLEIRAIAAIKAMRDEVPSKPRMSAKVRRWAANLDMLRQFASGIIDGTYNIDQVFSMMREKSSLSGFVDRIELYAELGYPAMKSAKGYSVSTGWTDLRGDGRTVSLELPNGRREFYRSREDAVEALRNKLESAPEGTERKTKLDVYKVTRTGEVMIGKKVASNKYIDLKGGFKTGKEAFQYYAENEAQLLELLEQRKTLKPERRSTNNPRVGIDYRLGEDVTPEKFAAEFGFRGVQFGNYVEQSRRARDLNNAYDALLDLANIIGVPPRAISLNGTLGLAFGARGSGGKNAHAAHYERDQVVINLTKVNGFGSLGHEWFHALDNYFSKMRGENEFLTNRPKQNKIYQPGAGFADDTSIRTEVLDAFKNLMDGIRNSAYYTRSAQRDNTRTKDYWSTNEELAARAFEAYLIAKSKEAGRENDYLANIEDEDVYEIANQAAREFGGVQDPYPYPTREEQKTFNPLFDALFSTLQNKETDDGNVVLFSRSNANVSLQDQLQSIVDGDIQAKGNVLTISENSPASLQIFGFNNLPVVTRTGADGVLKMHYEHGLSIPKLANVIENGLKRPLMILQHKGQGDVESLRFVTNETHNGNPVILAIQPDKTNREGDKQQLIATAFEVSPDVIARAVLNGDLLYRDTTAPVAEKVKLAISRAQTKYAREPRIVLGLIPNTALVRKHSYKVLSQSDIVKFESQNEGSYFSRDTLNKGLPKDTVQTIVDNIKSNWKNAPPIFVVDSMQDDAIPKHVREYDMQLKNNGATGDPIAFISGGKVFILSTMVKDTGAVHEALFHEVLGHYGLRGVYGDALNKVLDNVALMRRKDVIAKAKEYGFDIKSKDDIRKAAEEVLAEMAQTNPQASIVQRAIAAIRKFLRDIGFDIELSDNDIVANYLLPARDFVQRGGNEQDVLGMVGAFSRADQTQSEAFKKWFGDSDRNLSTIDDVVLARESAMSKSRPNSNASNSKLIADLLVSPAFTSEGLGGLEIPAQGEVLSSVLSFGKDRQILRSIIELIPVDVVNILARKNLSAESLFSNESMLKKVLTIDADGSVSTAIDVANALIVAIAKAGTKNILTKPSMSIANGKIDSATSAGISNGSGKGSGLSVGVKAGFGTKDINPFSLSTRRGSEINTTTKTFIGSKFHNEIISKSNQYVNNGNFDSNNNDIFFSRQGTLQPKWDSLEDSKMDDVIRALQDKNIDLKRVTQNIKKAAGAIDDRWNAYLQEELYHGRTAKRTQDFIKKDLEPLIEDMRMRGVSMAEFEEYLLMRHAEERNIQIAKINPDMQDGGSGVLTADAQNYLTNLTPALKAKYVALAKRIDAINKKSRQVLIDYGLESTDTIAAWEGAYQYYVPLMREDMDTGFGGGTGQGFSIKGSSTKRAMGSSLNVVDIIANIAQQYEKNIVRGEKNRVSTALIGLAKLNPNSDFWEVDTPPTIKSINKVTGQVEERTDPNYKTRDNVVVARIRNKLGQIEERSVVFNEFDERAMKMAVSIKNLDVDNMEMWLEKLSIVTRYFASINTQYNPIFGVINITRDVQGALLNLSTTEIAGKQKEVIANTMPALRAIYSTTRKDSGVKNPLQFGKFTQSQKDKADEMVKLFEEYQNEGGATGFRDMFKNAQDRTKAIEKALDPDWWTKTLAGKVVTVGGVATVPASVLNEKAIKPVFEWLSDYNQTLENAVRLSVYKVGLDNGLSKQQSASIAKNISVNFNRKGSYGRSLGAMYAFFNASAQGTARIAETLKGPRGKQIIAGGVFVGVMQAVALALAGYDDEEPPEFVRDRNIIIPLDMFGSDGKFITVPMPLGFNVLPNFGRITTEWLLSGGEDTSKRATHIFSMMMEMFNPIGGNGSISSIITPTAFDPFNDLDKNKDWTDRDIARKDFNTLDPTPGFTRTRDKAWSFSVELSRYINNLSGGDDYTPGVFSPTGDQIEYLAGQVTGGVGREIIKTGTTIESLVTGEDLPTYKIPLVGRFVGNSKGQAPQGGKFYNNLIKLNKIENGIIGRDKDGKDIDAFIADNPEVEFINYGKKAYKAILDLRKQKRAMVESEYSREEIKAIDDEITTIMTEFNDTIATAKENRAIAQQKLTPAPQGLASR